MFKILLLLGLLFILPTPVLAEEEGSGALPAPKLSFKLVCGEQPKGVFSWNQVSGANIYQLYTIKGQSFTPKEVSGTEATVNLSTSEDYKYTVEAMVKENGKVLKEGKWSNEVFVKGSEVTKECGGAKGEEREEADLKSSQTSGLKEDEEKAGQPKIQVVEKIVEKEDSENGQSKELEQKVQNLESELEKAKQRQNALEQMVNNLVNFIKNIFKLSF